MLAFQNKQTMLVISKKTCTVKQENIHAHACYLNHSCNNQLVSTVERLNPGYQDNNNSSIYKKYLQSTKS